MLCDNFFHKKTIYIVY